MISNASLTHNVVLLLYTKAKSVADTVKELVQNTQTARAFKSSETGPNSGRRSISWQTLDMPVKKTGMVYYSDLGGMEDVLKEIRNLIEYPLKYPQVYKLVGIDPPRGVLLHGPPGCGKTALTNAIANESSVPLLKISAPELVSGISGESETKIRSLFHEASMLAPCIIFIDEIDAIAGKRENMQREMERRIVAQILTCMDELANVHNIIIGATNRPDSLDPALRRAGRFDREIGIGVPTEAARQNILEVVGRKLRLEKAFDFRVIAKSTPGFVAADLVALAREAATSAINRTLEPLNQQEYSCNDGVERLCITWADFDVALRKVQPSTRREGFSETPNVRWYDVGSLEEVRDELEFAIMHPIYNPQWFETMGLRMASGILLFGPPGCGKTLVAKALANESGANFVSIKGPELLNKYVGESERAVRSLFNRAKVASPCLIFLDEIDAFAPIRDGCENHAAERVVNQLLTELDGFETRQGVYVVAATNRPDMLDPALIRPGRLDKVLYVPLPRPSGRACILRTLIKKTPIAPGVDLAELALSPELDGYSGADLMALVHEACVIAMKESVQNCPKRYSNQNTTPLVRIKHFFLAVQTVRRSISERDQLTYKSIYAAIRGSDENSI